VHEVSAVIAAEYFNETSTDKAFALVTAGPGLTNSVTGIAGSWLESRGVLIVGGQVKTSDLMRGLGVRQNGIQELNGVEIVKSICKIATTIDKVLSDEEIEQMLTYGFSDRPGPVFFEFCLDIQAVKVSDSVNETITHSIPSIERGLLECHEELEGLLVNSTRPVVLLGGGVHRKLISKYISVIEALNIPVMTTWNGMDRIDSNHPLYFGRPNTWGQRSSNIIIQQADLVLAIGTRLGLQQTGFNWEGFAPHAKLIQVDVDQSELEKGHPLVDLSINLDAEAFLHALSKISTEHKIELPDWLAFARKIRDLCPLSENSNVTFEGFINPYEFVLSLSTVVPESAVVVPCSSGGAFTTMMQAFQQKSDQKIVTNKGLASMGYGLAGAIGASVANPQRATYLVEGDGGFAQNLQELGTIQRLNSNIKIFIYSNEGYASIRMTQLNYFNGAYMGCDISTGLGLPNWNLIFAAYGIPCKTLSISDFHDDIFLEELRDSSPRAYLVPVHPEQTYYPKISSYLAENGNMVSNPIHLMTPPLEDSIASEVFRYT
jgi:acetolactate synthase-1/2/3 large subunit